MKQSFLLWGKFCYQQQQILINRHFSICHKYQHFLKQVVIQGKDDGGEITSKFIENGIVEITIKNIKKKNAISGKMMNDLAVIVDNLTNLGPNRPVSLIMRGFGDYFCSGADLSLAEDTLNSGKKGIEMSYFMTDVLNTIRSFDMVSLCIINGPAIGGGAEITTACDFRLIFKSNKYSTLPTICFIHAKVGASPGWGGANRLHAILGRNKSLKLLGGSLIVHPEQALQIGLVDDIFENDSDECDDTEMLKAAKLFLHPYLSQRYPNSIKAIKTILHSCSADPVNSEKIETAVFGQRWAGPDNLEAISRHRGK